MNTPLNFATCRLLNYNPARNRFVKSNELKHKLSRYVFQAKFDLGQHPQKYSRHHFTAMDWQYRLLRILGDGYLLGKPPRL